MDFFLTFYIFFTLVILRKFLEFYLFQKSKVFNLDNNKITK